MDDDLLTRMRRALDLLLGNTAEPDRAPERRLVVEWFGRLHAEIAMRNREVLEWLAQYPVASAPDSVAMAEFQTRGSELLGPSGSTLCARIAFLSSGLSKKLGYQQFDLYPSIDEGVKSLVSRLETRRTQ